MVILFLLNKKCYFLHVLLNESDWAGYVIGLREVFLYHDIDLEEMF